MSGVSNWLGDEAYDLEETEQYHMDASGKPFGRMHEQWLQFKQKRREGDLLYSFSSPSEWWRNCAGRAGYAWVRNGVLVEEFVMLMN